MALFVALWVLAAVPGRAFAYTYHADGREAGKSCLDCHGAPSGDAWVGRGPHSHFTDGSDRCAMCHVWVETTATLPPDPLRDSQVCYKCHGNSAPGSPAAASEGPNVRAEFFGCIGQTFDPVTQSRHPVQAPGQTTGLYCTSCHDPHADPATSPRLLRAFDPVTGDPIRSSVATSAEAVCWTCHGASSNATADAAAPGYYARTGDKKTNFGNIAHGKMSTASATRCGSCHSGHGSAGADLIQSVIGGISAFGTPNSVCLTCHKVAYDTWSGADTYATSAHGSGQALVQRYSTRADFSTGTAVNTTASADGYLVLTPVLAPSGSSYTTSPTPEYVSVAGALTNGNFTDFAQWYMPNVQGGSWGTGTVEVVVDLGSTKTVNGARVSVTSGLLYGAPTALQVFTGSPGSWTAVGTTGTPAYGNGTSPLEVGIPDAVQTRYVRLLVQRILDDWDYSYIFLSEVQVLSPGTGSGTWTTPVQDVSTQSTAYATSLTWDGTLPAGSSVWSDTRMSSDGGTTWSAWTSATAGSIPQLPSGASLANKRLQYRLTLNRLTAADAPKVDSFTSSINYRQSNIALGTWPGTTYQRYQCADCHDPHGTPNASGLRASGNALCLTCHDDASVVRPSDYSYRGSATYAASGHGGRQCIECHAVHGSTSGPSSTLLAGSSQQTLCYTCHSNPANSHDGVNVQAAFEATTNATSHHSVSATEQATYGTAITCSSCHDVHSNTPTVTVVDPNARQSSLFTARDVPTRYASEANIVADKDTTIERQRSYANYGAINSLQLYGSDWNPEQRILMHFDLSSIPPGSVITSAALKVYAAGSNSGYFSIRPVARDWVEGTGTVWAPAAPAPGQKGATWNTWKWYGSLTWNADIGFGDWMFPGGDTLSSPEVTWTVPATWASYSVPLTQIVTQQYAGSNYGIEIQGTSAYTLGALSRETASTDARPTLWVRYAAPTAPFGVETVGFCLKCHGTGATIPAGVKMGSTRVIDYLNPARNPGSNWHGAASQDLNNISFKMYGDGDLNPPYYHNMAPLPCSDCHESHGSTFPYHLKSVVNGRVVSSPGANGKGYASFCSACHDLPGHAISPVGYNGSDWSTCLGCHYHGLDL